MRKNISQVISAFLANKSAKGKSCSTDGETIFSYRTAIARRNPDGTVWVMPYSDAPSATTRSQVRACEYELASLRGCTKHEDCAANAELAAACKANPTYTQAVA